MTEFDRVGNSDNFDFRGLPSFLQVCEKSSYVTQKRLNVCTMMVLLYIYSKLSGVRLSIRPVIEIKF